MRLFRGRGCGPSIGESGFGPCPTSLGKKAIRLLPVLPVWRAAGVVAELRSGRIPT